MASKLKKHRAMEPDEWMMRLRRFAALGVWPPDAGNRPAARQKKWHELFLKIEKCPLQRRGQMSLFGGQQLCNCGFHVKKPSSSIPVSPSATSQGLAVTSGPTVTPALTSGPTVTPTKPTLALAPPSSSLRPAAALTSGPTVSPRKQPLTLASFTKPRFGGSHGASLKPNLSLAGKHSSKPISSSSATNTVTSATARTPAPARSPKLFIQTVSPLSLPPSPVSTATTEVSAEAAASSSPGPSSAPLAPPAIATFASAASADTVAGPFPVSEPIWLPVKLLKTIPLQDHKWISAALWKNQRLRPDLKLWYDPPEPALIYHQVPAPERFFTHRLLVWMPYHLWRVRLSCSACGKQLTGYGAHKRARHVLDVDRYYLLITETLWCQNCKTSCLSTSKAILDQLDLAHRLEFRLILTQKYACDMRVIRFLRERTLGNSPTRLVKQLRENHSEEWLKRLCRYLGTCSDFVAQPGLLPVKFQEPPQPVDIPSHRWMLAVYGRDILCRLDHIKASITSTFGDILKMDSTKKITKKLSGIAKGTAFWLTSVSNGVGQILISVLTTQEGPALDKMAADLISRYSSAGVAPPRLLYVDCDCCREGQGQTKLQQRFGGWPNLVVRLDIYHFLRRLASGCTKDAHPLYPIFMARLSSCIFEWDMGDVALLQQAKREQLKEEGVPGITQHLVDQRITKEELSLHCRRRTRGVQQTISMIEGLLQELMGEKGRDLLGVPLLNQERMEHIWNIQRRHVKCIQDEPGVLLYTQTGTLTKGGVVLPTYRCARGSTSLESFHLHVNRFIPGTSANGLNFQLYLLEGLCRWNQDREAASLAVKPPSWLSYSGDLVHCVNDLSMKVLGKKLDPSFQPPSIYTGELIGIDYLYHQTGRAMQEVQPDSDETNQMLEEVGEEQELEDEGFEDAAFGLSLDPTIALLDVSAVTTPGSASNPALSSPASLQTAAASDRTEAPEQQLIMPSVCATPPPVLPMPTPPPPVLPMSTPPPVPPTTAISPLPIAHTAGPSGAAARTLAAPEQQLAVDERGVPGMDKVDSLAQYLVGLRAEPGDTISPQQAGTIVALWQDLLPYDQQRVAYSARHQQKPLDGRYRANKTAFVPGVESMTRSVAGSSGSPAQWPDCCRLVESIMIKLCELHKSPKKQGSQSLTRWTLILNDYRKIRQLVLGNGTVMQGTTLQLFEVSQTTVNQWHNRRLKRQDLSILQQGLNLPPQVPVAPVPLPPHKMRRTAAPVRPGPTLQYNLPKSTVGQAVDRRKTAAPHLHPTQLPVQRQLFTLQPPQPASTPFPNPVISQPVFLFPQAQHPKIIAPSAPLPSPPTARRPYIRTVQTNQCRQCHQPCLKETGHGQYYGQNYCPVTATKTLEQWQEEKRRERADAKK